MKAHWFESHLQHVLAEAGDEGLCVGHIVRNVCNMEPALFGQQHTYRQAWSEIYRFLRHESAKSNSPYRRITDENTGQILRGRFRMVQQTEEEQPCDTNETLQMKIPF